jgi:hypothetical protein
MADNFDLKKFLKESKALENLNPIVAKSNLSEGGMREKIREYILSELDNNPDDEYDSDPYDMPDYEDDDMSYFGVYDQEDKPTGDYYGDDFDPSLMESDPEEEDRERDEAYIEGGFGSFKEAKKKDEEVEDVETTDVETTDTTEEVPAEETPAADGGLENIAANMKGTENDLMKNLMDALSIAKGMGNEKLETQIGNTLKFFVSEYIGSGGQE